MLGWHSESDAAEYKYLDDKREQPRMRTPYQAKDDDIYLAEVVSNRYVTSVARVSEQIASAQFRSGWDKS